jgi:membrane protein YqaA with SNARE-associated domain
MNGVIPAVREPAAHAAAALDPPAHTAAQDPAPLRWKIWALGTAGFLLVFSGVFWTARNSAGMGTLATLSGLLLYTSVACTFCPLPTAWILLWAARSADPLAVALTATLGTVIANLHDYYILNALCRVGWARKVRRSRTHDRAVHWFQRAPLLTLAAASLAPIPIDFVRMLAVSAGYPRRRYALATFLGRFPRYLLFAYLSWQLQPSNRVIAAILGGTVLIGLFKAAQHLRRRWLERSKAAGDAG